MTTQLWLAAEEPPADCGGLVNDVPDCTGLLPLAGIGTLWAAAAIFTVVAAIVATAVASSVASSGFAGSWFERHGLGLDPADLQPRDVALPPLPGPRPWRPWQVPRPWPPLGVPTPPEPPARPEPPGPPDPAPPDPEPDVDAPPEVTPPTPGVDVPPEVTPPTPGVDVPPGTGLPPEVAPPAPGVDVPPGTDVPPEVAPPTPGVDAPDGPGTSPGVDAPERPDVPPDVAEPVGHDTPPGVGEPVVPRHPPGALPGERPDTPPGALPTDPATTGPTASDAGDSGDADAGDGDEPVEEDGPPAAWLDLIDALADLDWVVMDSLGRTRELWWAVQAMWNGDRADAEHLLDLVTDATGTYDREMMLAIDTTLRRAVDNPMVLDDPANKPGVTPGRRLVLGRAAELAVAYQELRDAAEKLLDAHTLHGSKIDAMADANAARKDAARKAIDLVNEIKEFKADVTNRASRQFWRAAGRGDFEYAVRAGGKIIDDATRDTPWDAPHDAGNPTLPAGSDYGAVSHLLIAATMFAEYLKRRFGKG